MKVWRHGGVIKGKIKYIHVFDGFRSKNDDYVIIRKSLIEFGKEGQNFQRPGEQIFMGQTGTNTHEYSDVKKDIISWLFEDVFELEGKRFKVKE